MAIDRILLINRVRLVLISMGLTGNDLLTLLTIADLENQTKRSELDKQRERGEITLQDERYLESYSKASMQRLAYETGLGYSSIRRSLQKLVDMRILMVHQRRIKQPNWYAANPDVLHFLQDYAKEAREAYDRIRDTLSPSAPKKRLVDVEIPSDLSVRTKVVATPTPTPSADEDEDDLDLDDIVTASAGSTPDEYDDDIPVEERSSVPPARSRTISPDKSAAAPLVAALKKVTGIFRSLKTVDLETVADRLKSHPDQAAVLGTIQAIDDVILKGLKEAKNPAGYLYTCLENSAKKLVQAQAEGSSNDEKYDDDIREVLQSVENGESPGPSFDAGWSRDEIDQYRARTVDLAGNEFRVSKISKNAEGYPMFSVAYLGMRYHSGSGSQRSPYDRSPVPGLSPDCRLNDNPW